jgi:hypothetical protein
MPAPKLPRSQRLAVTEANRYLRGREQPRAADRIGWSKAINLAPEQTTLADEHVTEYRRCFAEQLVHYGFARAAGKSPSGKTSKATRCFRASKAEFAAMDAAAKVAGQSWNQWLLPIALAAGKTP